MKKMMLGALAVIMVLGSLRAFAMDDMAYEITEGKIAAAQGMQIRMMIEEMQGFQKEADDLYSQDGQSRVGIVSRLMTEAEMIMAESELSNFRNIDQAFVEVSQLRKSACLVVRSVKDCR